MRVLYLESSVVLAWLFGESTAPKILTRLNSAKTLAASALTLLETERALLRAAHQQLIKAADRQKLRGLLRRLSSQWTLMEITATVQQRCYESFPLEPIRILDAIHLATALEFLKVFPTLEVFSLDKRIQQNAEALGLAIVPL